MRTLTLLRHAKSSWDDPVQRDFDRPVNQKGVRAARTMGEYCFWDGYGKTLKPVWDRRIYLASCVTLLDLINEAPAEARNMLLVGHNPGLEDLVLLLVPDEGDMLRDSLEDKFPTASLAAMSFEGEWTQLAARKARLTRFKRPRDLDAALGPDQD
jgi:phosphohistidine phosphatase